MLQRTRDQLILPAKFWNNRKGKAKSKMRNKIDPRKNCVLEQLNSMATVSFLQCIEAKSIILLQPWPLTLLLSLII